MTTNVKNDKPASMIDTLIGGGSNRGLNKIILAIWVFLISLLTVNKYAPEHLNADIIMNSIMSLNDITLFYWGQNRLLNFLPFIVSPITSPSLNLFLVMLMTAVIFYSFLMLIAYLSVKLTTSNFSESKALQVFAFLSFFTLISLKPIAISSISIWHIEYSASALFVGLAICICLFSAFKNFAIIHILSFILVFLSTGINPSILLLISFIVFLVFIFQRKLSSNLSFLVLYSVISFFVWAYLSSNYGNYSNGSYLSISLSRLTYGPEKVIANISNVINWLYLIMLIIIFGLYKIITFQKPEKDKRITFIGLSCLLFSLAWIVFFSSNKWVELNGFPPRYFIYVFLALIVFVSFEFLAFSYLFSLSFSKIITFILITSCILLLRAPITSFKDYDVFKHVNDLSTHSKPVGFYSGNYWSVWPSVMRDLIAGKQAIGLTYRGQNQNKLANLLFKTEKRANVFCLEDSIENCFKSIKSSLNFSYLDNISFIKDRVSNFSISYNSKSTRSFSNRIYTKKEIQPLAYEFVKFISIKNKYFLTLNIINNGSVKIASNSNIGHPVRFSWRFLDSYGRPLSAWDDVRKELPYDIPASDKIFVFIDLENRPNIEKGFIEVSLVQEGAFWAHDIGVTPLKIPLDLVEKR